jgi:hypothetical protein
MTIEHFHPRFRFALAEPTGGNRYLLAGLGGFVQYFWNLAISICINPPLQIHAIDRTSNHVFTHTNSRRHLFGGHSGVDGLLAVNCSVSQIATDR